MIHLYAEHLLNIRTLSIQASLPTVSHRLTEATLSADGRTLSLTHEGEIASIELPIVLSPKRRSDIVFTIPAVPSKELTFRVQLEEKESAVADGHASGLDRLAEDVNANITPWTAASLSADSELRCASCSVVLVDRGKIRSWKDLPSDGWAEMMDFWHCHKPDHNGSDQHAGSKKGYAAAGGLLVEPGAVLVDVSSFLVVAEDCKNVRFTFAALASGETKAVICDHCSTVLGTEDTTVECYRLEKRHLSVSPSLASPAVSYADEKWLACLLLNAGETQGARIFIATSNNKGSSVSLLKLWIFSPDLKISSSAKDTSDAVRVAKIFWKDCPNTVQGKLLNGSGSAEGDISLLAEDLLLLRTKLLDSARLLPAGAKQFQDWNVGLLERFSARDLIR